ncbi:protein ALP1-like [Rana temporaria]|uniref:protein ALP1-like n=1 Tax=Rana temporaria TaxID=8407 RepID=UPI001AAD5F37|nr:protein ALP1-like [Rana temporaria]
MDRINSMLQEALLLLLLRRIRRRKQLEEKRANHQYRVQRMLSQHSSARYFTTMYGELRKYPAKFFGVTRMSIGTFDDLLERLRPRFSCMDTQLRMSVSPEQHLLVTLRFLATGQSFASLHHYFLMDVGTVEKVTRQTCLALWEELRHVVMPRPTEDIWEVLADEFWEKTQFPNCIGALDRKHVQVKMPLNSGSKHCNDKEPLSIVLFGLVDSYHRFISVDVGAYGSEGDSEIFGESVMGHRLYEGHLGIPLRRPLPLTTEPSLPLVIVADEAFGLAEHLMRPYSGHELGHKEKIFNYRLSRARQVAECAFGGCTAKWRVLLSSIQLDVENAIKVVLACCVLHNLLIEKERGSFEPTPPHPAQDVQFMDSCSCSDVMNIRNQFADFFVSPDGEVSWQDDHV